MPMRWRWPPLNSCGKRRAHGGVEPDELQHLVAPVASRSAAATPWARSPSAIESPTVARGSSDEYGSWNTTWMSLRSRRSSPAVAASRSWPAKRERPLVGVEQAQQDARQRGLAAARLADEAEHLALVRRRGRRGRRRARRRWPGRACRRAAGTSWRCRASLDEHARRLLRRSLRSLIVAPTVTATSSAVVGLCRKQRTWRPPACSSSTSAGVACVHTSMRSGQRSANRQPGGGSMSVGTRPRITVSSSWRRPITGTDPSRPWVYGCFGSANSVVHRRLLDDLAAVHHGDPVGHLGHHAEVVGDQHHARAGVGLQLAHQVEDLRLDRDVERGRRLVGDEQLGLGGQRHGDHHPLRLAARELVRVRLGPALGRRGCRPGAASRPPARSRPSRWRCWWIS